MQNNKIMGYLAALTSIVIWGTTFIITKGLLGAFRPVEIILIRMVIALSALTLISPRPLRGTTRGQELLFAAAGFSGLVLYFLLENTALTYSMASNVGVIISAAPFFTAVLNKLFYRSDPLRVQFFIGFVAAMTGIGLISWNGVQLKMNPLGDFLALCAAANWGLYSVMMKRISGFGFPTLQVTQRIFLYGVLFMALAAALLDFGPLSLLTQPKYLLPLLYLGLGASALCFFTWNFAVLALGPVRTSVSAYLVPVVTVASSALFLREPVTPLAMTGILLILSGLAISEWHRS